MNVVVLKNIFFITWICSRLLKAFDVIFAYTSFNCLNSIESKSMLLLIIWSIALNEVRENDSKIDDESAIKNWIKCFKWKDFERENSSSAFKTIINWNCRIKNFCTSSIMSDICFMKIQSIVLLFSLDFIFVLITTLSFFTKSLTNKMFSFNCRRVCFLNLILHALKCCCFRRIVLNFYS